jgi:hypothetical protein
MVIGRTPTGMLRQRACTAEQFHGMADVAGFADCAINLEAIGYAAWLKA